MPGSTTDTGAGVPIDATPSSDISGLERPLAALGLRAPLACAPTTPLGEALRAMQAAAVGSIVVVDGQHTPIGLFTSSDLLRVAAEGSLPSARAIGELARPAPVLLDISAPAFEAALLMAAHSVRHVVLVDGARLAAVISEHDLAVLQGRSASRIGYAVGAASDRDALVLAAREVYAIALTTVRDGASPRHATALYTALNDMVVRRAIEIELPSAAIDVPFCWILLGSEGRAEQTLATDQDNAVVFPAGAGDAEALRSRLLPLAERVNALLADCGIARCPGGIMAGNPAWCLSVAEWQARFANWISDSDGQALLDASIVFDFRPLHGDVELARDLRAWLQRAVSGSPRFLLQLARNALEREPPLGILREFALERGGEHDHTLDLKLHGTSLFVDSARVYALAHGIDAAGTVARLRAAGEARRWPDGDVAAWVDAFLALQHLRLRTQVMAIDSGQAPGNRIDPDLLNPLDRRILLEALRQARRLQQRLALDFRMLERGW